MIAHAAFILGDILEVKGKAAVNPHYYLKRSGHGEFLFQNKIARQLRLWTRRFSSVRSVQKIRIIFIS
jgi:hypothetical protein